MGSRRTLVRTVSVGAIATAIVVASGAVGTAAPEPPDPVPPDVVAPTGDPTAPSAEQAAAAEALGAEVRFDTSTGGVRSVSFIPTATAAGSTSVATARGFVAANEALFGIDADALRYRSTVPSPNGVSHIWFDQTVGGTIVHGAAAGVTLDAAGQVVHVASSLRPGLDAPATARLDAVDAVVATGESVGADPAVDPDDLTTSRQGAVTEVENPFDTGLAEPLPARAEPVVFALDDGTTRSAWNTVVQTDSEGWFDAVVDARTGEILERRNLWQDDHNDGEAFVYTVQHPQIAGAMQVDVDFPVNWADDSGETTGNNTDAGHDPTGTDSIQYRPDTGDPGDGGFRHFNYTFTDAFNTSGGADLTTDRDAVITQAFYYTNMLHDRWYQYGFNEASGNFQEDNFGNGGSDGDSVLVLVDWNADDECCNASMATDDDGINPVLRLRVGRMPDNLDMHRAMNGDTVTHEFGHGVSNRLVGGGDLGGGTQAIGMGEGWSDAMAFSLWNDPVYGEYNNGNAASGIRDQAYDVSTLTYEDVCACSEHEDGEVWGTALWDVRTALIGRYGQGPGTTRFELNMIDGMKFTPNDPSFLDARDGILASNIIQNGGVDYCLIYNAFAINGMGVDAVDNGDSAEDGFAVPPLCLPTADAGGPYMVAEGSTIQLDGSGSTPGLAPFASQTLTYGWDFDGDLDYDDAFGVNPTFGPIGDNMVVNVGLRVTSGDGLTDTDSTTVTVTNVPPDVVISGTQDMEIDEFDTLPVSATFTDPGWLDTYTATIDYGTGDGPQPATLAVTTQGSAGVPDSGTVTGSFQYGDNGTFTVTVTVNDDDGGTDSASFDVVVNNVDPTAAIDPTGSLDVNGVPTFVLHAGEELTVSGDSTDPGSDDLTAVWDWGDGTPPTATKYQCNPPLDDPFPSPSVQPRDITDTQSHTYEDACLYTLTFTVTDDDGGVSDPSIAAVVVQGNADATRSAGYWYQQYRRTTGGALLPAEDLACYLLIVAHLSDVFNEVTDISTSALASALLKGSGGPATQQLDRQLFAAWLNFANGAVDLDEMVDTNFDDVPDTLLLTALTNAETVRLNPASTKAQLLAQKDMMESINLMDA